METRGTLLVRNILLYSLSLEGSSKGRSELVGGHSRLLGLSLAPSPSRTVWDEKD